MFSSGCEIRRRHCFFSQDFQFLSPPTSFMYRMSENQSNSFKGEADYCNKNWKGNLPESKHYHFHLLDPILFNKYVVFFIATKWLLGFFWCVFDSRTTLISSKWIWGGRTTPWAMAVGVVQPPQASPFGSTNHPSRWLPPYTHLKKYPNHFFLSFGFEGCSAPHGL